MPPVDSGQSPLCERRFTSGNKCSTLVGMFEDGGGCACVRAVHTWKISVSSSRSCVNLKLLLKMKSFKKIGHISRTLCASYSAYDMAGLS